MSIAALVLAAGRGERLGQALPKAFVALAGRTLVERSIAALARVPEIACVVPVVAPEQLERFAALALREPKLARAVAGGAERQDSVEAGLAALGPEVSYVAVHDAARCLVRPPDVARVLAAARETGAALLARPARDTIKRVRDGAVLETPPRAECWAAQTPQVFRVDVLREAIAKARAEGLRGTDDAELVERLGVRVRVVLGHPGNLKITEPGDLDIARAWLAAERR